MIMLTVMIMYWKITVGCILFVMAYDVYNLIDTLRKEKQEDAEMKSVDESLKTLRQEEITEIDKQLSEAESYTYTEITILLKRRRESIEDLKEFKDDPEIKEFVEKVEDAAPVDLKKLSTRKLYL